MHVLLIEDNPADIYLLQEGFAALNGEHRLSVAKSVAEAREFLSDIRPDAALLDLSLPDSFGLDTFAAVQAACPDMPIIVLSGNSDQTTAIEAVRSGAQDYIMKGDINQQDLLRTLTYSIERASIKSELRRSEARFRRLFDSVPVGVFQMTNKGELTVANAALVRNLGFESEAEVLRAFRAGSLIADDEQRKKSVSLLNQTGQLNAFELKFYQRGGDTATMLVNAAVVKDDLTGDITVEGTMVDISERKLEEERLRVQAERDELTGIANRRAFRAMAEASLNRAASDSRSVTPALLMFDLDGFKAVNDDLGHDAGDKLLQLVAERVSSCLRTGDLLARHGGDEFTILCNVARPDDLCQIAEKILTVVTEPMELAGQIARVGASIGIAIFPQDGDNLELLLKAADAAMYRAKKGGKGRYEFASGAADPEAALQG